MPTTSAQSGSESVDPDLSAKPVTGWGDRVIELLGRVAAEQGLDHDPSPEAVTAALPHLVAEVERLAAGMSGQERRWLAAALTALSEHVQRTTLPDPPR